MSGQHHQRFLSHLADSQAAVWRVANWLNGRGHSVTVHAAGKATKHEEWQDYADTGDLSIAMRVEVKGLSADFTSREDWPFGEKFIVCAKHAFDRATPKPYGYLYLNKSRTHAAMVMSSSSWKWTVEKRKDKRYQGIEQDFYFCPMSDVIFTRLDQ